MFHNEGLRYVYRGWFPYAINYISNYSLQMALFEVMMRDIKATHDDFENHEFFYVTQTSFFCGLIGSGLTNCFQVKKKKKQADSSLKVFELMRQEGLKNLAFKGLAPRMVYHS